VICPATFTYALQTEKGRLPQAIAHRGNKADFPENSMKALEGAIAIGAHALETDIHITKDKVVVLSHVCQLCSIHVSRTRWLAGTNTVNRILH
jgi:glycerophosphoryl diester phosphodiesterase